MTRSQRPTRDVELAYARDRENLERLAAVLGALGARPRGAPPDLPFLLDAETLASGGHFFATDPGPVDIPSQPDGAPDYARLATSAVVMDIAGGPVRVASLDHLIAMKRAPVADVVPNDAPGVRFSDAPGGQGGTMDARAFTANAWPPPRPERAGGR